VTKSLGQADSFLFLAAQPERDWHRDLAGSLSARVAPCRQPNARETITHLQNPAFHLFAISQKSRSPPVNNWLHKLYPTKKPGSADGHPGFKKA
jgi:hypothetical protein